MSQVTEFNEYRQRMNEKILAADNKVIKRFFNLDTNTYQAGALDVKTKEMLGLACSMVLRCDDCIKYHLGKCHEEGINDEEIYEVFAIANLIGGSIVIPHFRRAVEYWEILKEEAATAASQADRATADQQQRDHEQAAHGHETTDTAGA
jgi:AhpD family alkylhydroperoxidase